MANTTPVFTAALLSGPFSDGRGGVRRVTYDLTNSYGGFVMVRVGRSSTVAIDVAVKVRVNRLITFTSTGADQGGYGITPGVYVVPHPAPLYSGVGGTGAAAASTIAADADVDDEDITVASGTGFTVGDLITIDGGGGYATWEVHRIIAKTGALLSLETPLIFAHTAADAAPVLNKADAYAIPVDGGSVIEVVIDYGAATTGDSIDTEIFLQQYPSDVTT